MPPLPSETSVAPRIRCPHCGKKCSDMDDRTGIPALLRLRFASFGHSGNRVRADADLVANLVCRHVVRDQPERRRERTGSETRSWLWQLPSGLDVAAQIKASHGASWSRSLCGRIEVLGRQQFWVANEGAVAKGRRSW